MEDPLVPTPYGRRRLSELSSIEKSWAIDYMLRMIPEEREYIQRKLDKIHEYESRAAELDPETLKKQAELVKMMREEISMRVMLHVQMKELAEAYKQRAKLRKLAKK